MQQTLMNDFMATPATNSAEQGYADAVPQKLKAEDFRADDIEGVAHSAAGSGQMTYMMLQARQTGDAQAQQALDTAVGGSADIGNMAVGDAHAARASLPSAAGESGSGSMQGHHGGFGGSVWNGGSLDGAGNETRGSGVAVGSISAAAGQGGSAVNNGFENFASAQSASDSTSNTYNNSNSTVDVNGGNTTTNMSTVTTTNTTYNTTNVYNYEDNGGDDDNHQHQHGPLLNLDVDLDLGHVLAPVEQVLDGVGSLVGGVLAGLPDVVGAPLGDLPGALVSTLDGTLDATQDVLQTLTGGVLHEATTLLGNVSGLLAPTLADVAAGNLSVNTTLDRLGLGTSDLNLHLEVRGLGPVDVPVGHIVQSVVDGADQLLGGVQDVAQQVLEPLGVADLLQGVVAELTPALNELDAALHDVLGGDVTALVPDTLQAVDGLLEQVTDGLQDVAGGLGDILAPLADVTAPVQDVLSDVLGGVLTDSPLQDLADNLLGGLGLPDGSGTDSDLLIDASLGGLGLVEDINLDPVEALLGDVDMTLNLDNLGNPADLLELNIDALNGDVGSGLDVGAVVGDVVANISDHVAAVLPDVLAGAGELAGSLNDGLTAALDLGNADATTHHILDGVGEALGFGGSGGDTDIVGDVDLSGLGHGLDIMLEVPLDPVEHILGDIDLNVGLGEMLGDGALPELDVHALVDLVGMDDGLDVGGDHLGNLTGGLETPVADLGSVVHGAADAGEDLIGNIGHDVLDTLNETVGDLLPPVAHVADVVSTPLVNHVADVVNVPLPAPVPVVVNVVSNLTGHNSHHGGGLFGLF